jgi:hypothetical protein
MKPERLYNLGLKIARKEGIDPDESIVRFCIEDVIMVAIDNDLVTDKVELKALLSDDCLDVVQKCFEAGIMEDWTTVMKVAIELGLEEVGHDPDTG